ncbi:MAG: GIY-YIG nuclease family protein [Chloroflexota bacterium]|nr:GIY-YIG nuclease family protein [Chloroflexota bacterium]
MNEEEVVKTKAGQVRPAFVYILECVDGSLYTGWTWDVTARLKSHNAGKGAKYTRARLPVSLVYTEQLPDEHTARQREYAIKQLTRAAKLQLIKFTT